MISIKLISSKDCFELRKKVLWPHKKLNQCSIDIDNHPDSFHLGAFCGDRLVSMGSFFKQENKLFNNQLQYRLRAMATDNNYRNIGSGSKLIKKSFEILKKKKIEILWCDARLIAVDFYKKNGFKISSNIFEIPIIGPHYVMKKLF
jgi:predicted GNAT family N-acyltransferase